MGQLRNKVKGNRSVGKLGKANLVILYRNELGLEKQTILRTESFLYRIVEFAFPEFPTNLFPLTLFRGWPIK